MSLQSGWRCCRKCNGLFFAANAGTKGACPAGGAHDDAGSSAYAIEHRAGVDLGAGPVDGMQPRWRWCSKCQGLFFGGVSATEVGRCPAGGQHKVGQGNYLVPFAGAGGATEAGWSWCGSCYGLHKSSTTLGKCPTGSAHITTGSGAYVLTLDATQAATTTTAAGATSAAAGATSAAAGATSATRTTTTARPTTAKNTTVGATTVPTRTTAAPTTTATSTAASTLRETLESATSSASTPRTIDTTAPTQVVYATTTARYISRSLLQLGDQDAGLIEASGGGVRADVITTIDADGIPRKRLSAPRYADLLLTTRGEIHSAVRDWIKRSLDGDDALVDGRVVGIDNNDRECEITTLCQARIDALRFPILDAAAKDPIAFELKVRSQGPTPRTVRVESSGQLHPPPLTTSSRSGHLMLGMTQISLDGVDCSRIYRASELVLTRGASEGNAASRFHVGNFTVRTSESGGRSLLDWFNDFVVLGNNGAGRLKNGSITLRNAAGQPLLTLSLSGVGIVDQTWTQDDCSEPERRPIFELFCEQVRVQ